MLRPKHIINTLLLLLAPVAAFAHPGHADGSPIVHEVTHALHYIAALVTIGLWITQRWGRLRR